jgi:hypothetical protein
MKKARIDHSLPGVSWKSDFTNTDQPEKNWNGWKMALLEPDFWTSSCHNKLWHYQGLGPSMHIHDSRDSTLIQYKHVFTHFTE